MGKNASQLSGRQLAIILPLFFGVFVAFGVGAFCGDFLPKLRRAQSAKNWLQTPCIVESCRVASRTHSGGHGDSTTYSIDVLFEYSIEGHKFKSSQYQLNPVSTSDFNSHQRTAASLRQNPNQVCYVNPQDPADAVMDRSSEGLWLSGGLSIVFGLWGGIGEAAVIYAVLQNRRVLRVPHSDHVMASGFVPVKPAHGALAKTLPIWAFAILWSSLTLAIDFAFGSAFLHGDIEWTPIIILGGFTLVGMVLFIVAAYQSLAVLDPVPHVVVNPLPIRLGHPVEVRWQILSKSHWIDQLKIEVRGCQIKRSDAAIEDFRFSKQFWHHGPAETSDPAQIRNGFCQFTIPATAWPTRIAEGTKVACVFLMEGKIPNWPAMRKEFLLPVETQDASH